ncbi:MAG: DUF3298 domain-containing protein [Bacteroidaceae bacterium]|nr:DUF3298 domain-containing protein [Bacteroidaceae bacterium]
MKKYLFILTLAVFFCACVDWKTTEESHVKFSWRKASLCVENPIAEGDSLCYHIEFNLDTLAGDGELASRLAAVLRDSVLCAGDYPTIQEAMAALADSMETEWKAELAEMYDAESDFRETLQYYYTVEGSPVESGNDSILSYQSNISCYLGGAHGSYVVSYYNFEKKTGKLLNIHDIIPEEAEMFALMAMEEQLCKDWGAKDLADLQEKTGITMLGDLYLTNNFLVKGDSILFLFNQYEIAPYAAGLISVTVKKP